MIVLLRQKCGAFAQ